MHLSVIGQLSPKVGLFNIFSSTPSNLVRHKLAFNRVNHKSGFVIKPDMRRFKESFLHSIN